MLVRDSFSGLGLEAGKTRSDHGARHLKSLHQFCYDMGRTVCIDYGTEKREGK